MGLVLDVLPDEKALLLLRLLYPFYCFSAFMTIGTLEINTEKKHVSRHKDSRMTLNSYKIYRLIWCILFH